MEKYGGTLVHCQRDEQGLLEVVEAYGVRSLHFGSAARQSTMSLAEPERLEMPYLRAMLIGLAFVPAPCRCLILGLGGGSLARFLAHHLPSARIEVVELRPALVEIAREYFGLPGWSGIQIHLGDAGEFVARQRTEAPGCHDLILVDLFDAHGLAPLVLQPQFQADLRHLLSPSGVVCVNLWQGDETSYRTAMRMLREQFPGNTFTLPVSGRGNLIGVGLAGTPVERRLRACLPAARQWERRMGIELSRLLERLSPPLRR